MSKSQYCPTNQAPGRVEDGFVPILRDDEVTDPEAAPPSIRFCPRHLLGMSITSFLTGILVLYFASWRTYMAFDKPEIRVDSVYVCPTNTASNNSYVIWDLKFDITNTENHTLCIPQFEVSVFSSSSYNQTTPLLAKTAITPTHTCLGSTSHTSALGLVEEEDSFQINGTFGFDLKIHAHFYFRYDDIHYRYVGHLVCKDAEVAFLTSNLSCGCLVGDPLHCYYEYYELDK